VNVTYAEIGATLRDRLPDGYNHLRVRVPVGDAAAFAPAVRAVMTWRMHRGAGLFVTGEPARPGLRVTGRLGTPWFGFPVRCEVIGVVDEPNRGGFAYGTLPGHAECGEEAFLVERTEGRTFLHVIAFSRPAAWYARAAGPLVPVLQRAYARRLGATLRRLGASSSS